jgi:hypothetical protein
MSARTPALRVVGRCPSCLNETLFLGAGGHVTCSWVECNEPVAASRLLQNVRERAAAIMEELAPLPEKTADELAAEARARFAQPHPAPNAVNHPAHYGGDGTYEAIKVIEAWELDFSLGNAVKYISRAGRKPGADEVEDLEKARWYLTRAIQRREGP